MINVLFQNRRKLLSAGAALAAASFFGKSGSAFTTVEDIQNSIEEFGGGAAASDGRITLAIPEIAEDGNRVPVSIVVESPMAEDDFVESVMILAPGNPLLEVATMHFTIMSGKAEVSTRMRLAQTQDVLVFAKMSDGSLYKDVRHVNVTIGGCGS